MERIQRVSEAEVESFGRRAAGIRVVLLEIHRMFMGFMGILRGIKRTSGDFHGLMRCIFGQVWVMRPILGAHYVIFWPSEPFRGSKVGGRRPNKASD